MLKYASQLSNQEILGFLYSTPFKPFQVKKQDGNLNKLIKRYSDFILVNVCITSQVGSKTGTIEIEDFSIRCPFDKSVSVNRDWHAYLNAKFPNEYIYALENYEERKTLD